MYTHYPPAEWVNYTQSPEARRDKYLGLRAWGLCPHLARRGRDMRHTRLTGWLGHVLGVKHGGMNPCPVCRREA